MFTRTSRTGPTSSSSEALRLVKVTKVYGSAENAVTALDGVSLSLPAGSFTAVMGPSGSGKSFGRHQPVTPVIETLRGLLLDQPVGDSAWLALTWCGGILIGFDRAGGGVLPTPHRLSPQRAARKRRRRRLLLTTKTLENAIAAPAIMGLSNPAAARGRAATL